MTDFPALPQEIDPNAYQIRFVMHECRGCDARSEWYRADSLSEHSGWDGDHAKLGRTHRKFYLYSMVRNTAEVWLM